MVKQLEVIARLSFLCFLLDRLHVVEVLKANHEPRRMNGAVRIIVTNKVVDMLAWRFSLSLKVGEA